MASSFQLLKQYNDDLIVKPEIGSCYGEYVIALSSFNGQYYLDRIVVNKKWHDQTYDVLYYDPAYRLYYHKFNPQGSESLSNPFHSILKEHHVEDVQYCRKIYKQYLSWAEDRLLLQLGAEGKI